MSVTDDPAVSYAARRLGDQWELVLRIAEAVQDRGLELPEISEPAAVDAYIDEHISVARAADLNRQAANIVAEIAPADNIADSLKLGRILEMFGGDAAAGGTSLADLFNGHNSGKHSSRSATAHADATPNALGARVRAQLYGKALSAGPDAVPAELWETITRLA